MVATVCLPMIVCECFAFSPLFIGAMVATYVLSCKAHPLLAFQSPFHRGNGCYLRPIVQGTSAACLSVPFSSGQWLLPYPSRVHKPRRGSFQSPFHRGNGCYDKGLAMMQTLKGFQSPFHRGNGCYPNRAKCYHLSHGFQSPFHRGNGCYKD